MLLTAEREDGVQILEDDEGRFKVRGLDGKILVPSQPSLEDALLQADTQIESVQISEVSSRESQADHANRTSPSSWSDSSSGGSRMPRKRPLAKR